MSWIWGVLGFVAGGVLAGTVAALALLRRRRRPEVGVFALLHQHFWPLDLGALRVASRHFPMRVRTDVQRALDRMFDGDLQVARLMGVRVDHDMFGISLSNLLTGAARAAQIPVEYEDVDIGEQQPVRVQENSLWLVRHGATSPGALLLSKAHDFNGPGRMRIDIAAANDPLGDRLTSRIFEAIEKSVRAAASYRGKVLSLEKSEEFSGEGVGLTVHTLTPVSRDEVILPPQTLELLDRNVIQFVRRRDRLGQLGQAKKKGLLFFGPPGTGKTHTIRYLASSVPGQTTLLMTAEQVGNLAEYMALARLLQPSIVVIEDVDLIARARELQGSACTESLLNKLLNEMDGLKEDAEIIFILTTNRPEDLEEALAARPGRVDQAIEFPYPDDTGRHKLVQLYGRGVALSAGVESRIVQRTSGVSGAFIKELIRRSVQFQLERADDGPLDANDVENALTELLQRGGRVNLSALGASVDARQRLGF